MNNPKTLCKGKSKTKNTKNTKCARSEVYFT